MFTFVIGKGGVGKTTVSSAYALWRAAREPRKKLLLLSTDPAHSLSDILQVRIGDRPRKLKAAGRIYVSELNAASTVSNFLQKERDGVLKILEEGSIFTREELAPFLDSALPGTSELAALLAIDDLAASGYDEIVVDTAPLGHTLRLFEMPAHLKRFLHLLRVAASRDRVLAAHFGGRVEINSELLHWEKTIDRILQTLGASGAELMLVTTPETFSLQESLRAATQLRESSAAWSLHQIVLNRIVTKSDSCPRCARRARQAKSAFLFLNKNFKNIPLLAAVDPGSPIAGWKELTRFGHHIFEQKPFRPAPESRASASPGVRLRRVQWPSMDVPLTLTAGKGGVGKTTISAGLAYRTRKVSRVPVAICSIDPAPSLNDIFEADVRDEPQPVLGDPGLLASEIDAVAEYERWAGEMQRRVQENTSGEVRGIHVDLSFERELLSAVLNIVPPGVDEVLATFRMIDYVEQGKRVQIDMAPTGHAIEVLQTPARLVAWTRLLLKTLALHRTLPLAQDAAVELATVSERLRNLVELLKDPGRSRVWVVMLAEPLPDRETRFLVRTLRELRVPLAGLFVNRVLPRKPRSCARCVRIWRGQRQMLSGVLNLGLPVFVVPEHSAELKGRKGLERLTSSLWELQQDNAK